MLENKSTLCFEMEGLTREGLVRLSKFLNCATLLFDSRLLLVLFSPKSLDPIIEKFSEECFLMQEFAQSQKKPKLDQISSSGPKKVQLSEDEVNRKDQEIEAMLKKHSDLEAKLASKEDEVVELKSGITLMEEKLKDLEKEKASEQAVMKDQVSGSCEELKNLKDEHDALQKRLVNTQQSVTNLQSTCDCLTEELKEIKNDYKVSSEKDLDKITELRLALSEANSGHEKLVEKLKARITELEKESQVKKASGEELSSAHDQSGQLVASSMLSTIRNNFNRHDSNASNAADLVYMSIKDLKCELTYSKIKNRTKCHVTVVKGKHNILKFPQLLIFDGEGESEKIAKLNAFDNFILLVKGFRD